MLFKCSNYTHAIRYRHSKGFSLYLIQSVHNDDGWFRVGITECTAGKHGCVFKSRWHIIVLKKINNTHFNLRVISKCIYTANKNAQIKFWKLKENTYIFYNFHFFEKSFEHWFKFCWSRYRPHKVIKHMPAFTTTSSEILHPQCRFIWKRGGFALLDIFHNSKM